MDELGGYQHAIEIAAKLAKLGKDYDVEYFDAETSLGQAFGLRIRVAAGAHRCAAAAAGRIPALPPALSPLLQEAQRLARLKDPGSLYAYCVLCSID